MTTKEIGGHTITDQQDQLSVEACWDEAWGGTVATLPLGLLFATCFCGIAVRAVLGAETAKMKEAGWGDLVFLYLGGGVIILLAASELYRSLKYGRHRLLIDRATGVCSMPGRKARLDELHHIELDLAGSGDTAAHVALAWGYGPTQASSIHSSVLPGMYRDVFRFGSQETACEFAAELARCLGKPIQRGP